MRCLIQHPDLCPRSLTAAHRFAATRRTIVETFHAGESPHHSPERDDLLHCIMGPQDSQQEGFISYQSSTLQHPIVEIVKMAPKVVRWGILCKYCRWASRMVQLLTRISYRRHRRDIFERSFGRSCNTQCPRSQTYHRCCRQFLWHLAGAGVSEDNQCALVSQSIWLLRRIRERRRR